MWVLGMFDRLSDEALLDHHKVQARRLVHRKRLVLGGLVLVGVPVVIFAPSDVVHAAWLSLLGLAVAIVAFIEIQRFLVFKKDRAERRSGEKLS